MQIIPSTPDHYPALAALINTIYPGANSSTEELLRFDQEHDPRFRFQRWLALEGSEVIATGNYNQTIWFAHPQKFAIAISVHPDWRRQGIGTRLYEAILDGMRPFDPIALRATAVDLRPEGIAFLQHHGFVEVIRDIRSELEVQSCDLSRFAGLEERFRPQGVVIHTLPELASDPGRDQKLYDLDWELSMIVPGDLAATMERRGLEKYVQYAIRGEQALPQAFFVAVRGEEYVGLSHSLVVEPGVLLYQGLTGVKAPWQRLGIGLAMKVRGIAHAKAAGYRTLRADNDARNLPMLALNETLGFVRTEQQITFEKALQPGG